MTIPTEPSSLPVDTPLREVTDDLDRSGNPGQFQALEGGELRCLTCGEHFPAAEESADRVTRLEGASDPSDMAIIVPHAVPALRDTRHVGVQLRTRGLGCGG